MATGWNHNTHHHPVLLAAIPPTARRALDVGCGLGAFARELSHRVAEVVAIDRDPLVVERARAALADTAIEVRCEDFLATDLGELDVVTMIAALHHMPLEAALTHAARALRPGGVLGIIGLAPATSLADYMMAAVSFPTSLVLRRVRHIEEVGAPTCDPREPLAEIRDVARRVVPGAAITRRLLFRYTLVWTKP